MWRVFGVLLVLAYTQSEAQYDDQFRSWRRDVGLSRGGNVWPPGSRPVYPHNAHHVPSQGRRNAEPVTERDREPLEPHSSWAGRNPGNADIEQLEPEDVDPDTSAEEVRPEIPEMPVRPIVPSYPDMGGLGGLGGLGGFGGFNGQDGLFATAAFDFGNPLGLFSGIMNRRQKWWQGPNVCVERKEIVDEEEVDSSEETEGAVKETVRQISHGSGIIVFNGDASFESCSETNNMYTCTKRKHSNGKSSAFTVTYKCCHGFRRNQASRGQCDKVDMKPVMEIVEKELGAGEFAALIRQAGLTAHVDQQNITLFVPSDEAMKEYENMSQNNQVDYDVRLLPEVTPQRKRRQIDSVPPRTFVMGHTVSQLYDLNELTNEQLLQSDNDNSTIRINVYPRPGLPGSGESAETQSLMTANCARITRGNLLTTSEGLVHGLDGVLMPAGGDIFRMLEAHGEFTILAMALRKTGLHESLMKDVDEKGEPAAFTLFAPTDRAFEQLDAATRMKIVNGDSCTLNILKHHILPHTLCSAAVPPTGHVVTTRDAAGDIVALKSSAADGDAESSADAADAENNEIPRSARGGRAIRVDDAADITRADIVATNGVIHIVDAVMLPESARSIASQLQENNFTLFRDLISAAGMTDYFADLSNATVFAVPDDALQSDAFKQQYEKMLSDKEEAERFLRYHVVTREVASCDMRDEEDLPTDSEDGKNLRINLYSTLPMFKHTYNRATANCARVMRHDLKSCDSTVHEVDRPLLPPNQTIWELLESDPQYSIVLKMLKDTELETVLRDSNDSFTLLAPTDDAFNSNLRDEDLNELMEDKEMTTEVLKMHILPEVLCCSGIGHNVWPFVESVRSLSRPLNINRDPNTDEVYIGTTTVAKCDQVATNGVIHRVDKLMLPQRPHMRLPFFRQFMFY